MFVFGFLVLVFVMVKNSIMAMRGIPKTSIGPIWLSLKPTEPRFMVTWWVLWLYVKDRSQESSCDVVEQVTC